MFRELCFYCENYCQGSGWWYWWWGRVPGQADVRKDEDEEFIKWKTFNYPRRCCPSVFREGSSSVALLTVKTEVKGLEGCFLFCFQFLFSNCLKSNQIFLTSWFPRNVTVISVRSKRVQWNLSLPFDGCDVGVLRGSRWEYGLVWWYWTTEFEYLWWLEVVLWWSNVI